jgi:carbamoylphosphate synthase large subunit
MVKILITGAGSVMGQSIYKALVNYNFEEKIDISFANSEELAAGRFFTLNNISPIHTPIFPMATDLYYLEHLENYIQSHDIDIVFSGTQHELEKISLYRDKTIKAATLPSSVARLCLDKLKTSELLTQYDIRVPVTQLLKDYLFSPLYRGAVIVKPNTSSASRNIFRFNDYNEALSYYENKIFPLQDFIVQECLTGEEYTCGCYVDRYTQDIKIICLKRTLTPDGATSYGEIIVSQQIEDYVYKIAQALIKNGLDFGHFNVQLIVDNQTPCLFEINGRLSSTEVSKAYYGFNSCAAFVMNIVKQKPYHDWNIAKKGRFLRYYDEVYF